ncbi:MAG: ATP-binding cassette domain-containing protein [Spirochaetaceae bacterium]|nr:ATP-binding cassette domain-containing protein [Spirochaetaceae bacterium]
MGDTPAMELRNVNSVRGEYAVLDNISMAIGEGEACFIMGSTGSGKSGLIKTMAGIRVPDSGEVIFRGVDLARMSRAEEREFRRSVGFVFQDAALWANKSLFDNLALPVQVNEPSRSKVEVERAVRRAAELVGYDDDLGVRPSDLSSGERKLIGLARALVLDPTMLLMDEPAVNLDEASVVKLYELVESMKASGRTLVIVSSSSDSVSRFADRVAVIRGGKLLAYGSYSEAVGWADPALRAVTGRLKSRVEERAPIEVMAAAWAEALTEDAAAVAATAAAAPAAQNEEITLGDIINDAPGEAEEAGDVGEVQL